jgi:UDP-N-acetylmuramoyl-tripeptide--D-alanyl-D-alanine ligase
MKPIFKILLKYYLKYITKLVLAIHRPLIIAVAGSTNKTFIKDEIKRVLEKKGINARANIKSFNTEIGLPLAVLNIPSGYNSYKKWLTPIKLAALSLFQKDFPRVLVLELGISQNGDMKYLLSIIKPKIIVISDITQRYLESFSDMDELVSEYKYLAEQTGKDGLLVLNYDNMRVREIAKNSRASKVYFGLKNGADWQAIDIKRGIKGEMYKVKHNDEISRFEINRFGIHHVYAAMVKLIINETF